MRWYLRYGLSYRDLEELLAEQVISMDPDKGYRCRYDERSATILATTTST